MLSCNWVRRKYLIFQRRLEEIALRKTEQLKSRAPGSLRWAQGTAGATWEAHHAACNTHAFKHFWCVCSVAPLTCNSFPAVVTLYEWPLMKMAPSQYLGLLLHLGELYLLIAFPRHFSFPSPTSPPDLDRREASDLYFHFHDSHPWVIPSWLLPYKPLREKDAVMELLSIRLLQGFNLLRASNTAHHKCCIKNMEKKKKQKQKNKAAYYHRCWG